MQKTNGGTPLVPAVEREVSVLGQTRSAMPRDSSSKANRPGAPAILLAGILGRSGRPEHGDRAHQLPRT